ncbi:MAG: DUF924 domain-containing protein [Robiginitomaculum sp.]|nr:DUF924 domain-containing protein [Robiginitomaculum sp.]
MSVHRDDILADDILNFWFEEAGPVKWYARSDAFDADIRARFEDFSTSAAAQLKTTGSHAWQDAPDSALALIIALDQFSRNMYRDTKGAFAWDDLALACAKQAVDKGYDLKTGQTRRAFFYLPYMHAEDLAVQDECVRLMDMCIDDPDNLFHAKEHRKLIARFGRYAHRNAVLGRNSTDEEIDYLNRDGYAP